MICQIKVFFVELFANFSAYILFIFSRKLQHDFLSPLRSRLYFRRSKIITNNCQLPRYLYKYTYSSSSILFLFSRSLVTFLYLSSCSDDKRVTCLFMRKGLGLPIKFDIFSRVSIGDSTTNDELDHYLFAQFLTTHLDETGIAVKYSITLQDLAKKSNTIKSEGR